ncbi:hypothetical protein HPP92_016546 [Vanilla planifolia]|uniref:Uncharacterized protein n=1 Tax=Vanilla planifolia TaxID=51239 RepID=A0A835UTG3_VANPL|nr:hypothetical protein HPP92_016546 [Vanilla planifolia]
MAVISRLRRAIRKLRFFITFNLRRWLLSSSSSLDRRRLSLPSSPRSSGLFLCSGEELCSPPRVMTRTISGLSASSDDIDKRAEDFIERFHRHLRMERGPLTE